MTDGDRQHDKDNDLSKGPGVCLCVCVCFFLISVYIEMLNWTRAPITCNQICCVHLHWGCVDFIRIIKASWRSQLHISFCSSGVTVSAHVCGKKKKRQLWSITMQDKIHVASSLLKKLALISKTNENLKLLNPCNGNLHNNYYAAKTVEEDSKTNPCQLNEYNSAYSKNSCGFFLIQPALRILSRCLINVAVHKCLEGCLCHCRVYHCLSRLWF